MTIDKKKILSMWQHRKARQYVLGALAAFALVGVLGIVAAPPLVKSLLSDRLAATLHRPVTIKSVSINPYALSVTVDGLAIQERDGGQAFAGFDSLYLNLESSSLFRGGPVFAEIRLVNPKITIVRFPDNRYNFSDLVDEFLAKPRNDEPAPAFSLNNIQLSGGVIEFDDRLLTEKHIVSDIRLSLPFVSNMVQASESFVEPAFSAQVDGAPLAIKGKSKPFAESRESELLINLDKLQLAAYQDYLPFRPPIKVMSGVLDGQLKFSFRAAKPSLLSVSGNATVTGLAVNESSGSPLLVLKRLDLVVGSADLLNRKFVIDRVAIDAPEAYARVGSQGIINWQDILAAASGDTKVAAPAGKMAPPAAAAEWSVGEGTVAGGVLRWLDESSGKAQRASLEGFDLKIRNLASRGTAEFDVAWRVDAQEWLKVDAFSIKGGHINLAESELSLDEVDVRGTRMLIRRAADGRIESLRPPTLHAVQALQQEAPRPWKIKLAKYHGEDLGVRFEDKAVSPSAVQGISDLNVDLENLSTEPGQATKLAGRFKLNGKGQVELSGNVNLVPLAADIKLAIKTVELLPLQPYFTEKLNIELTGGQVTLGGDLQLRQAGAGGPSVAPGLAGGFKGVATIGEFSAVDKINSADFLKWKSLYFGALDLRLNPDAVAIGEIALSDFFARVIVSPEGKLNLLQMIRHDDSVPVSVVPAVPIAAPAAAGGKAVAPVAAANKPLLPVKIDRVTLQAGSVNFTDNFVKPNYSARLREIGGRVSGLSSVPESIADLELRGSYDNVAPLNVTARVNPFSAKPYLDLQAEIKGVDMSSLSPYSGKYAGYAIEKGKLSLFVKYKIENNLLTAENRVFLDQLTFGEPVASPDATKLPVTLAVALLKNRRGEIDINLPISGSLDDPQFSVGGLVVRVIVNLFVKAVSSPFALLGSLFGSGGGEMSTVDFAYGRATISEETQSRLENLAKALIDRPALKLEIDGHVDSEHDHEGLKQAMMERKVRVQKRDDLAKSGAERSPGEVIEVSAAEYPALLERVYRAEKFPKPRTLIGLVKTLPVDEMEKLILTNTSVDDDDLRALGDRRARAVRDWLLGHEVPAERMFLLPSKLDLVKDKPSADEKYKGSRVDFTLK